MILWTLRFLLAGPLIAAGILKAVEPVLVLEAAWAEAIPGVWLAMRLLPWAEIALGILLLSEAPLFWSALAATATYSLFVGVVAWRLLREGWAPDCGCFGALVAPLARWHLLGNIILCAVALGLVFISIRRHQGPLTAPA